jgi:hypothetical protein
VGSAKIHQLAPGQVALQDAGALPFDFLPSLIGDGRQCAPEKIRHGHASLVLRPFT